MLHEMKGLNMAKIVNNSEYVKNKLYKIYKKTIAFTLAETLIVMGVIGVVAALTLPNLNQSTNNKEKVAKLQKIYSNLNDAFGRATAVYGPMDEWCSGLTDANCKKRHFERVTEFMKYSKKCTVSDNCSLKFNTGSSGGNIMTYGVILADGTAININGFSSGAGSIMVDIDGLSKGKNYSCYDYFQFNYSQSRGGLYLDDISGESISVGYCSTCCAAWVIQTGNMDYLKCTGLKLGEKTTCK